jgi:glycine cleavage system H protein
LHANHRFPNAIHEYFPLLAHEYVKVEGNVGACGITDFAQSAIVFVDLPGVGDEFEAGDSFGSVESVKAASDVYAPVSGTIIEINEKLEDSPELVNSSAEDEAWFVKIEMKDTSEVNSLMDEVAYEEHCKSEA